MKKNRDPDSVPPQASKFIPLEPRAHEDRFGMGWAMWIYPVGTYLDVFFVFVLVFPRPAQPGRPASDFFSPLPAALVPVPVSLLHPDRRRQVQIARNTHPTHTDQIGFGFADDANKTYRSAVGDRDWTGRG